MPKKRKRARKQDRSRNHRSNAQRSQQSVLNAFGRWVRALYPEADATEYEDVARTAIEMKANRLGEASPADWDAATVGMVVGEVMPAKMIADDDFARAVAPGMRAYLEFLAESGRFREDESSRREALQVLDELEPTMVERFRDLENKSMAGRIMTLAADEGVDITDEAQVEAFIQRYNSMPQEWREQLTGGPDPARAAANADALFDVDELFEVDEANGAEVNGDEEPLGPHLDVVVPREKDEFAALLIVPFLQQVTALLDWVGSSRPVTGTGALRRKDIPEVADRLGIELPGVSVQSMWQLTELADVWFAATECGILERTATTVRPGPHSEAWRRGGPADVVRLGRALVGQLVLQALAGQGDMYVEPLAAQVNALLATLLGTATAGVQHDLRELGAHLATGATPAGRVGPVILDLAMGRLERLARHGVVSLTETRLRIARPLGPSFIQPLLVFGLDLHPVDADGRDAPWQPRPMPGGLVGSDGPEGEPPAATDVAYQVKVQLTDSKPPIWRRLRLPRDTSLADLHDIIQTAFEWTDSHLHRFSVGHPYGGGVRYEPAWQREFDLGMDGEPAPRDEAKVTLAQLARHPRDKIHYLYDFGDDWLHTITVESIDEPDPDEELPRCTGGRRMAPYDDSGGVWGWEMMVAAALDETDEDHEDVRDWLGLEPGDRFDPDEFDPEEVTEALQLLRQPPAVP